jgi:hypothetical protein
MKMCTFVVYPGPLSFSRVMPIWTWKFDTSHRALCPKFLSPKRHNRGKAKWTIQSFILQSSHIMILNSTKFGGNRRKDVEVCLDRRTDRQADSYIPAQTMVDSNSGSSDSSTDYEELLINKGANIFHKCNSGRMPIHYVFKKIDS